MAELKDTKINGDLTITGNLYLPNVSSKIVNSTINIISNNIINDTEINNLEILGNIKANKYVLAGSLDSSFTPTIYFMAGDDTTNLPNQKGEMILLESTKPYIIYKKELQDKTYQQIAIDLTAMDLTKLGEPNGIATLDENACVPLSQLLSFLEGDNLKEKIINICSSLIPKEISKPYITTTWQELKNLRDNSKLIPGNWYRITDYTYVSNSSNDTYKSANHQFDILVLATSENNLNENAKAIQHEGDIYFSKCNLNSWEIKYSLDNRDTNSKYYWCGLDSDNGKGIIYYLKDENNNICYYDFKSVLVKVYQITNIKVTSGALKCYIIAKSNGNTGGYTIDRDNPYYFYSFNQINSSPNNVTDMSVKPSGMVLNPITINDNKILCYPSNCFNCSANYLDSFVFQNNTIDEENSNNLFNIAFNIISLTDRFYYVQFYNNYLGKFSSNNVFLSTCNNNYIEFATSCFLLCSLEFNHISYINNIVIDYYTKESTQWETGGDYPSQIYSCHIMGLSSSTIKTGTFRYNYIYNNVSNCTFSADITNCIFGLGLTNKTYSTSYSNKQFWS